jgi:hypothetical protein
MATNPTADVKALQHLQFPGESASYRMARNELLAEEMEHISSLGCAESIIS